MSVIFKFSSVKNVKNTYFVVTELRRTIQNCNSRQCSTRPKQKIGSYLLTKYLNYFKRYENAAEKKFPAAMKIYRGFSIGLKEFKHELISLFQIIKKINQTGIGRLTAKELEIYHRIPKDIVRLTPILILTAIPFGTFVFPLAYMFPRKFLSSHFWNLQQRSEFAIQEHKEKLIHYRPVLRSLQGQLRSVKDRTEHKDWSTTLGMLGSGVHPPPDLILKCLPLFAGKPYHLSSLSTLHKSHLLRIHGMHWGWRRRTRLSHRGRLLIRMDAAILRDGGPDCLSGEDLRWACFFRGLNPANVSHMHAVSWLQDWLRVSSEVDDESLSLILHLPILLAYNEPSNWLLLHDLR